MPKFKETDLLEIKKAYTEQLVSLEREKVKIESALRILKKTFLAQSPLKKGDKVTYRTAINLYHMYIWQVAIDPYGDYQSWRYILTIPKLDGKMPGRLMKSKHGIPLTDLEEGWVD